MGLSGLKTSKRSGKNEPPKRQPPRKPTATAGGQLEILPVRQVSNGPRSKFEVQWQRTNSRVLPLKQKQAITANATPTSYDLAADGLEPCISQDMPSGAC